MKKEVSELSNRELVKKYNTISNQYIKLVNWFCNNNLGHLTQNQLRDIKNPCKELVKYFNVLYTLSELRNEAKRRYGPDLVTIDNLLRQK